MKHGYLFSSDLNGEFMIYGYALIECLHNFCRMRKGDIKRCDGKVLQLCKWVNNKPIYEYWVVKRY